MFSLRFFGLAAGLAGLLGGMLVSPEPLQAQSSYTRPPVIDRMQAYKKLTQSDPDQELVELHTLMAELVYDLRYASTDNFTKQALYPTATALCFLRRSAAEALLRVAMSLQKNGLGLKIFDAYRPYAVTEKFWKLIGDERYVAHPAKGSGHNRGIAVDLTLIELKTKKELDMGTGFDNFTDTAHHSFRDLSEQVLQNRKLLRDEMSAQGFLALDTEWWHYALPNGVRYPLLNIPFKKIK
ncbi:MAG: peptidase M15 [Chitinophagia bacterium]|nr:peptidase M15 [Chitinophagia bacterium]